VRDFSDAGAAGISFAPEFPQQSALLSVEPTDAAFATGAAIFILVDDTLTEQHDVSEPATTNVLIAEMK